MQWRDKSLVENWKFISQIKQNKKSSHYADICRVDATAVIFWVVGQREDITNAGKFSL